VVAGSEGWNLVIAADALVTARQATRDAAAAEFRKQCENFSG
jgi:hypothetical protein